MKTDVIWTDNDAKMESKTARGEKATVTINLYHKTTAAIVVAGGIHPRASKAAPARAAGTHSS